MRHAIKKILGYILDNIIINMWYKFHQNRFSRSRDILSTSLKKVGSFEKNAREKKSTALAYYCDQKILDTNVIVLSYILKRPLCINNLNFDCVNFENIYRENIQKVVKIRQME
jgi:hypothetical protein